MNQNILSLFKTRDRAVLEKNQQLLLSTQTGEIKNSGIEGYLKTDKVTSTPLHIHKDSIEPALWIALVQEDYFFKDKFSHRNYLLYKLVEIKEKILISEILW